MTETPQIQTTPPQPLAIIHLTIPRSEMRTVIGPALSELHATIAAQGLAITGPWLTHHLRMVPDIFDFEICLPVSAPVTPAGRVISGEIPAMTAAHAVFTGNYSGLGAAWSELGTWLAEAANANGLKPATDLWECYLAGPESNPDPAAWRTELIRPLTPAS